MPTIHQYLSRLDAVVDLPGLVAGLVRPGIFKGSAEKLLPVVVLVRWVVNHSAAANNFAARIVFEVGQLAGLT